MNSVRNFQSQAELRAQWEETAKVRPRSFPSEIAQSIGISEGELLASKVGHGYTRLRSDWKEILNSLSALGAVKSITRNQAAVLERDGTYPEFQHFGMHSMFVSESIDLRITLHEWQMALAVQNPAKDGRPASRSLQFFAKDGLAVHKLFLLAESNQTAYQELVERFQDSDQSEGQQFADVTAKRELPDESIDQAGLLESWSKLEDSHGFFGLLHGFKVSRPQAMRLAEGRFTQRVSNEAAKSLLQKVAAERTPLMIFVSNKGCMQIYKGALRNVVEAHGWLNVMDPGFELHLKEEQVADSWLVEKPTTEGGIRSLELFDSEGKDIASLFGVRAEGRRQSMAWHALLEGLRN
jgi:putative hemin transport protein